MTIKRYRKKPIVIEAWQYHKDGADCEELRKWCGGLATIAGLSIHTLESNVHYVSDGDYVIKGVAGEFYACKPDIFATTYDDAE